MRYFIRGLDIAICETDASAARYATWREATRAEAVAVWQTRDLATLAEWRAGVEVQPEPEPVQAEQREVGHCQ